MGERVRSLSPNHVWKLLRNMFATNNRVEGSGKVGRREAGVNDNRKKYHVVHDPLRRKCDLQDMYGRSQEICRYFYLCLQARGSQKPARGPTCRSCPCVLYLHG